MAEITREERDDAREGYTAAYGHGTLVHKLLDALDAAEAEELEARAALLTAIARAEAAEAREAKLRGVLGEAEVILGNMAAENNGKRRLFGRWKISDEPLRNDAMRLLPVIRATLAQGGGA